MQNNQSIQSSSQVDLGTYPENYQKTLEIIIDNQKIIAEILTSGNKKFEEIHVNLAEEIWKDNLLFEIVQVSAMKNENHNFFYTSRELKKNSDEKELNLIGRYATCQALFSIYKTNLADLSKWDLKNENLLQEVANEIKDEIFREVWSDLSNNCGTIAVTNKNVDLDENELFGMLFELSSTIKKKTFVNGGDWLIAGERLGRILAKKSDLSVLPTGNKRPINLGHFFFKWKLIIDPLFPDDQILTGVCDPKLRHSGYFYFPHVTCRTIGDIIGCSRGKKLPEDGCLHYGMLKIERN